MCATCAFGKARCGGATKEANSTAVAMVQSCTVLRVVCPNAAPACRQNWQNTAGHYTLVLYRLRSVVGLHGAQVGALIVRATL